MRGNKAIYSLNEDFIRLTYILNMLMCYYINERDDKSYMRAEKVLFPIKFLCNVFKI